MFTRVFAAICLMLVLTAPSTGCAQNPAAVTVNIGEIFTIGVGQTAKITGEMTITFDGVISDSRAPDGAQAIWAGEAASNITVRFEGVDSLEQITLHQSGRTEQAEVTFDGYRLNYSLNPYPIAGQDIAPKDYRLTMTLTKSASAPIIDNGAIVRGEITGIGKFDAGYPWQLTVNISSVGNASDLPNLVAGKEGQTVDIRTDKDIGGLKVGDNITAIVKLSGDIERGTFFYASEIVKQ